MASFYVPPEEKLPVSRHTAVGAWFFGPRAENIDTLKTFFEYIVDQNHEARTKTYPNDTASITDEMKATPLFQEQMVKLERELELLMKMLSLHSVPFWSPRYNAHMSMETSMPAVVGYLAGMIQNQNNVALEASPWTTYLEMDVGQQLCTMVGYKASSTTPKGWGHITCGGSVANLESIWSARNLKFYPLSLKLALAQKPLSCVKDDFVIQLSTDEKKRFMECSTWELLNLKPSTILNIPKYLYEEFGISQTVLTKALDPYTVQTMGKDTLEKLFDIELPARMFVGATKHYSWPKGAAIVGIGRNQVVDVPVDFQARMDPDALEKLLEDCLTQKRAVYSVVTIIGSTEHGAVDPLDEVIKLRGKFEKRGLSFLIHADGAWGGYFTSLIRKKEAFPGWQDSAPKGDPPYVPAMALSPYTEHQLDHLQYADSITIDPHKSGYCPYPAGGLLYKDERQRFLVTWTSPVVYRGDSEESIGVYGVEGSKPGAAPVSVWLSHKILGLHDEGYGSLLGEAILTCSRLYCHWATMELKLDIEGVEVKLIVTPFTMLPAEKDGETPAKIEEQKEFIRREILEKENEVIYKNAKARDLLQKLGGDIQINNFACNFAINGVTNTDIVEANYLNNFIFNKLSLSSRDRTAGDVPLFLTSTQFSDKAYGDCLKKYKDRLGVKGSDDLYTLINVTMGPWSTKFGYLKMLAEAFKETATEGLKAVVRRNVQGPDYHGFLIQGIEGDRVCGVHLPMFNMQNHRWQLIVSCKMEESVLNEIRQRREKNPDAWFVFANRTKDVLDDFIKDGNSFDAMVEEEIGKDNFVSKDTRLSDIKIVYKRSMAKDALSTNYPDNMMFYVYSAAKDSNGEPIFNMDHLLNVSPNIQLTTDAIKFDTENQENQKEAEKIVQDTGAWFSLNEVYESALQPFIQLESASKIAYDAPGLHWTPNKEYTFQARAIKPNNEPPSASDPVIFTGKLRIGTNVFADAVMINSDGGVDHEEHKHTTSTPSYTAGGNHGGTVSFGLAAEHPTPTSSLSVYPEYKYLSQKRKIQSIAQQFQELRVQQAREVIDNCKDGEEAPGWAKFVVDDADKGDDHANGEANGHH